MKEHIEGYEAEGTIRKVLRDRLVRELSRPLPKEYLVGYESAVQDCYWDLFAEVITIDRCIVCNKIRDPRYEDVLCEQVCDDCYPEYSANEEEQMKKLNKLMEVAK